MKPVRVWDLPTRIFHWSFALSFAGAWLTAESERWINVHMMLGYTFAALIAFRLVWGVVGSRHARFASFLFSPAAVVRYLKSLLTLRPEHHVGHNPAGALAIFLLLGLGAVIALTGIPMGQEMGGEWLEELHEGAASVMLAVVAVHVAGVIVSSVLHRENLARAMVTGWKRGHADEGIRGFRSIAGVLLLVAIVGAWGAWQAGLAPDWLPGAGVQAMDGQFGGHDEDRDDD
ncbi:MAG: cytochrome b/b6 domain-containing protein [Rhodocyclaceae bacterium]|nr:cytochrome b/b6 domain-containing protein [Rhodocyclaceae bacterium]